MLPSADELGGVLTGLANRGFPRAVTPALSHRDAQPFLTAGFTVHEHLHLLGFDLRPSRQNAEPFAAPLPDRFTMRHGRRWHERSVIDVDFRAFEPFWRFDQTALREARRATPRHWYRVIVDAEGVQAYAVTGLAGRRGYLQRLAVSPDAEGQGLGRTLIDDALRWLRRRSATRILVNTQERNRRALALYEGVGFEPEPSGLVVLEWTR